MSSLYWKTLEEIKSVGSRLRMNEFRDIEFMGPIGWALIKSYIKRNSISISEENFFPNVARYLRFVGTFEGLNVSSNPRNVIKMNQIGIGSTVDSIADSISEVAREYIRSRGDQLYPNLKYYISELASNIPHHSQDISSAYVCGQYYRRAEVLQIAIIDSGIGILNSLRATENVINHDDAILRAIEPGITGNPGTGYYGVGFQNMGFGLPICLQTIRSNSGDFFLGTGNKMLIFNGEGSNYDENYRESIIDLPFNWQGTFIVFNLYTGKQQYIDYTDIYDSIKAEMGNLPGDDIPLAIF